MITVYAGTRPKEIQRVVKVVCRELKKLRTHGIDAKDLARVKNQMKGSLMLSLESSHSRMSKFAKDEAHARVSCFARTDDNGDRPCYHRSGVSGGANAAGSAISLNYGAWANSPTSLQSFAS